MTGALAAITGQGGLGQITLADIHPLDIQITGTATANFFLNNDGTLTATNAGGGSWCTPGSLASQFDARLTFGSGDSLTTGTVGSWLNMGTNRSWVMQQIGVGTKNGVFTLEIRETASGVVRASCTITFTAQVAS